MRSLISRERYEKALGHLAEAKSSPNAQSAAQSLVQALGDLERLPRSIRRLAWACSFGDPIDARQRKAQVLLNTWEEGINRVAGGMPEPSGAAAVLIILGAGSSADIKDSLRRTREAEAFSVLYQSCSAGVFAVDTFLLAQTCSFEQLARLADAFSSVTDAPEAEICRTACWLHAFMRYPLRQCHPPRHAAAIEILRASWARGIRRSAARRLGLAQGTELRESLRNGSVNVIKVNVPISLKVNDIMGSELDREMANFLAPLLIEWLLCFMRANDPEGGRYSGVGLLMREVPHLFTEVGELVGNHDSPARSCLQGLIRGQDNLAQLN